MRRRKSGSKAVVLAALLGLLLCAGLAVWVLRDRVRHEAVPARQPEPTAQTTPGAETGTESAAARIEKTTAQVAVPVDFSAWQERNPDVYAWISFPEASIDYPVVQSPTEDSYYLDHDIDNAASAYGAIYTQHSYNAADFNDPVTVIYGHNMRDGSMFGGIQPYMNYADFSQEQPEIVIYMPGRILKYRVIGSVPYGTDHILYYNDFSNALQFDGFFDRLYATRSFYNSLQEALRPTPEQRVIILSTCMNGESDKRYLTVGVLTEELP